MEVRVSDLTWDQFIYPRGGKSEKTIDAYVEALAIGAQFPSIKVQMVFNCADGNETTEATITLDGIHHWSAFKESGIKKIAAVRWKDKPLDYEKNKVALFLESAKCNISHGDRLSTGDKKRRLYIDSRLLVRRRRSKESMSFFPCFIWPSKKTVVSKTNLGGGVISPNKAN